MRTPDQLTQWQLQDAIGERYALERELGRGGMGRVWLARDLRLDRPVAIKLLHPHLAADPAARECFLREARTAAGLAHPHIVPVLGVESRGDTTFLVMAVIDGETLGARVRRRGPLPSAEVERVTREVGWALGYAHSRGVIHRDITPENILLERGTDRALLVDFGLAGVIAGEAQGAVGTPGYLAPEVIRGDQATPASDVYALAAASWYALSGTPPFGGNSAGEILARHLVQPLPDLPLAAHGASRRLVDALHHCLQKDPESRPADVASMLAALDRAAPTVTLAPAMVEWFTRWERIRVGYAIATPVIALQLLLMMELYLERGGYMLVLAAGGSWILATIVVPLAAHLAAELASLHRLAMRGLGIADIRAAWAHWTAALERTHRSEGLPPLAGRVVFDLTVVGVATIAIGFVLAAIALPLLVAPGERGATRIALMALGSWVFLGTAAGLSINFLAPGVRLNPQGVWRRLSERFWRGPLGGLLARVARGGLSPRAAGASSTIHRNTELVLGLAIETLWSALPDEARRHHPDVPRVTATLQHGAEELREMITRLREACDALPPHHPEVPPVDGVLHQLERQHREAVAQLESLRLHLLRSVSARAITTDLTAELAAAREAERLVLHGVAGAAAARAALGRTLRGVTRGTPTPSPTPT